ncbi:hypothetical protein RFI_22713 [Reticulomyxa filosa]|uniref:Uncharacterized protein n=1 Tax=Reticulomyxa filosa TaxID=46433 RepID=X6MMJ4_RETFI|nr:hypothetical protein RFI_22713 [Reticulomyxa filosa]|eukprot:ETO14657.1 hypothetical protein RFI_22713 [Reticulomyxa filosa]
MEDLGYYQAYTDSRGKRYIRLKVERVKYWIGTGVRITRGAYHILEIKTNLKKIKNKKIKKKCIEFCNFLKTLSAPMRRKITLGEMRLARYLHERLKTQGYLKGLPEYVPPVYADITPGKLPHDEWKKDVLEYQYVGKLFSTRSCMQASWSDKEEKQIDSRYLSICEQWRHNSCNDGDDKHNLSTAQSSSSPSSSHATLISQSDASKLQHPWTPRAWRRATTLMKYSPLGPVLVPPLHFSQTLFRPNRFL